MSKDEIFKQKNSQDSSIHADHQILETANPEEKLIDEKVDHKQLSADHKQSATVASEILTQKPAGRNEDAQLKLYASKNMGSSVADAFKTQRATVEFMEAFSQQLKDTEQSDLVSDVKEEIQKLQASVSSEVISTTLQHQSTNFQVGISHQISGRLDQYSDVLTDLSKRVTKIEANQVKLMSDIADIKMLLLVLVPQEQEVRVPSSTQQEDIKIYDVKKREKETGTENQEKAVDDALKLVPQVGTGIVQAEAGQKSQIENKFAAGRGLNDSSSNSTPVILSSTQLKSSKITACQGKDKGKGVVLVQESKKKNDYVPMPNVPKFLDDVQETGGHIIPVEMVTTTGETKLAYHTTKEFVSNDEEIASNLHEEEVISQQREKGEWEITKEEKRRRSKLFRKRVCGPLRQKKQ